MYTIKNQLAVKSHCGWRESKQISAEKWSPSSPTPSFNVLPGCVQHFILLDLQIHKKLRELNTKTADSWLADKE